jgi:hypothetical protein
MHIHLVFLKIISLSTSSRYYAQDQSDSIFLSSASFDQAMILLFVLLALVEAKK